MRYFVFVSNDKFTLEILEYLMAQFSENLEIIRRNQVLKMIPISVSTLYQKIAEGKFPKQIKLGARAVGWNRQEVIDWLASQNT